MGFEAYPPEINSGLMYSGPGAAPLTTAAAAWTDVADSLYSAAAGYATTITDLTSSWRGPSSESMAGAATTYVSWIATMAALAHQTAAQAQAAAAAYEVAFAATVPPAEIAANRALLLALIATNFFGQNTPAIMATEAVYLEMWAQDATAMYGYAGASQAATTMTTFPAPPETTTSAAGTTLAQAGAQTAGSGAQVVSQSSTATMPGAAQALASTSTSTSTGSSTALSPGSSTALPAGTSAATGTGSMLTSAVSLLGSSGALAKTLGPGLSGFGGAMPMFKSSLELGTGPAPGAVSAMSGRAASLGTLSVPPGWTSAAPSFSHVASALPPGTTPPPVPAEPSAGTATAPLGARPAQATEQGSARSPLAARYNFRPPMVQRPVYAG